MQSDSVGLPGSISLDGLEEGNSVVAPAASLRPAEAWCEFFGCGFIGTVETVPFRFVLSGGGVGGAEGGGLSLFGFSGPPLG
jgi:hypothetical protein